MDRKIIAIIVLSLACAILAYIAFKPTTYSYSEELIKQLTEQYEAKEKVLEEQNARMLEQNVNYKRKLDSLQKLKPKIEIKYVNIYKDIDTHTNNELVNEFTGLFTDNGIK